MGKALVRAIDAADGVRLAAALEHESSPLLGEDAGLVAGIGERGVAISAAADAAPDEFDVLIDFTVAAAVEGNLRRCRAAGKRMVIGVTGLDARQRAAIEDAAADIAIVFAPNMSAGVNLMFTLTRLAAAAIGANSDIEILEAHHSRKRDAPSGTALALGEIAAAATGRELRDCAVYDRAAHAGQAGAGQAGAGQAGQKSGARAPGGIGFASVRGGDIVGEHTVMFASSGERLEIKHIAADRRAFADGAILAARWIMRRERGLFDMRDVLGLTPASR